MPPPPNKTSAQKIGISERRGMALDLRKQGGSYRAIAETLRAVEGISDKYSEKVAHDDVMAELRRINAENGEKAADVRDLELQRLDEIHAALWDPAMRLDWNALDRLFKCMDRRSAYLGLDAPKSVNVNVTELDAAVEAELARLRSLAGVAPGAEEGVPGAAPAPEQELGGDGAS